MKFLFLEPFYGGSHKAFADSLKDNSRHDIELMCLPSRFWKWRMRGAALEFSRRLTDLTPYDGLIATDLMDLSVFKALTGCQLPSLIYFHENQLTYPAAAGESVDYHYGFTDIINALAADRILFNSRSHRDQFFGQLPGFINMMPDCRPRWAISQIRQKAGVCYPGCDLDGIRSTPRTPDEPPLIVWNHRWEHDKRPEAFFEAVFAIAERGVDFRLAVLGEAFKSRPPVFDSARQKLGDRILQFGYVPSRAQYINWLKRATVVISTAVQENFGISVVEAVACGCVPLLPNRLSYPEIMPAEVHASVLYDSDTELVEKLSEMLLHKASYIDRLNGLARKMTVFSWQHRIADFDAEMEALASKGTECT